MSAGSATYDLTNSMGITGQFERPEFEAAVRRLVAAAASATARRPGFLATSVEMARDWRAKGFRCLSYGTDIGLLQTALSEGIAALRRTKRPN